MSFADWLDARDGAALEAAWSALDKQSHELAPEYWNITPYACAQFGAGFLGWPIEDLAWLADDQLPEPIQTRHESSRCFLEHWIDRRGEATEEWLVRERVKGDRGVQHIVLNVYYDDGTREGGGQSATVVRVFDRAAGRGISVQLRTNKVIAIGDVDLSTLDIFEHSKDIAVPFRYELDHVRGFLAQLGAEVDAHFDVSPTWSQRIVSDNAIPDSETRWLVRRFESGAFALELVEHNYVADGVRQGSSMRVTFEGLPPGHELHVYLEDKVTRMVGHLRFRLPRAQGEAILARLANL